MIAPIKIQRAKTLITKNYSYFLDYLSPEGNRNQKEEYRFQSEADLINRIFVF